MRFKANVSNPKFFGQICGAVSKVYKQCILGLRKDRIRFICQTDLGDGTQVWGSVKPEVLFEKDKLRLESQAHDNAIYLLVDLDNLIKALKSGENAKEMEVKLAKRGPQPVMSFSMLIQNGPADRIRKQNIVQEVPVRVVNQEQASQIHIPSLPPAKVEVFLPPLKELKSIVDRMKSFSNYITLIGDLKGNLTVKVDTMQLSAASYFRNLHHPIQKGDQAPVDPNIVAQCTVETKKMVSFLYSHQLAPQSVMCCLVEGEAVALRVQLWDDANLVFFLPVVLHATDQ